MLEHQKLLLKNLHNQPSRFKKELEKSAQWLNTMELTSLANWLSKEFGEKEKRLLLNLLQSAKIMEAV